MQDFVCLLQVLTHHNVDMWLEFLQTKHIQYCTHEPFSRVIFSQLWSFSDKLILRNKLLKTNRCFIINVINYAATNRLIHMERGGPTYVLGYYSFMQLISFFIATNTICTSTLLSLRWKFLSSKQQRKPLLTITRKPLITRIFFSGLANSKDKCLQEET